MKDWINGQLTGCHLDEQLINRWPPAQPSPTSWLWVDPRVPWIRLNEGANEWVLCLPGPSWFRRAPSWSHLWEMYKCSWSPETNFRWALGMSGGVVPETPPCPWCKQSNDSNMCPEVYGGYLLLTDTSVWCIWGSTFHPISRDPSRDHPSPGLDTEKTLK